MSANARFTIGVILLAIGSLLPLLVYPVAQTDWPAAVKTAVGGALFFGFEIMAVPAVAVMGRENFDRIIAKAKSTLRGIRPSGSVGKVRHTVGMAMFLLPIVPAYIMAYMPEWLPDASMERIVVNLAADAVFLASLFVLGGDFWDKLRALFVREARAVFPEKPKRGADTGQADTG